MNRPLLIALLLSLASLACSGDSPSATPGAAPTTAQPTHAAATPDDTPEPTPSPARDLSREPLPTPYTPLEPLAILGGTLIDGTGAERVEDAYVFIADGRIEGVGCCASEVSLPDGYAVIDASGLTVMPGLVDGHVHVTRTFVINDDPGDLTVSLDENGMVPFLSAGFTTLRDVGTATVILRAVAFQFASLTARNLSATVIWAGPLITAPGGYPLSVPEYRAGGQAVESAEDAVALVDELADGGARIIKLGLDQGYYGDAGWAILSLDVVSAIADRAHEHGMRVTAHVTSLDEVRLALDGGVDDLAHAPLEPIPDDLMAEMLARDMGMVTTATVWGNFYDVAAQNAKRYADAGGTVSIGTDYGCCGQVAGIEPYIRELQFLNAAGMTNEQLVLGATRNGAIVANVSD